MGPLRWMNKKNHRTYKKKKSPQVTMKALVLISNLWYRQRSTSNKTFDSTNDKIPLCVRCLIVKTVKQLTITWAGHKTCVCVPPKDVS